MTLICWVRVAVHFHPFHNLEAISQRMRICDCYWLSKDRHFTISWKTDCVLIPNIREVVTPSERITNSRYLHYCPQHASKKIDFVVFFQHLSNLRSRISELIFFANKCCWMSEWRSNCSLHSLNMFGKQDNFVYVNGTWSAVQWPFCSYHHRGRSSRFSLNFFWCQLTCRTQHCQQWHSLHNAVSRMRRMTLRFIIGISILPLRSVIIYLVHTRSIESDYCCIGGRSMGIFQSCLLTMVYELQRMLAETDTFRSPKPRWYVIHLWRN